MRSLTLVLLALVAACRGPSVHLTLILPDGWSVDEVSLVATVYELPDGTEVTCDGFAYGDFTHDDLALNTVLRVPLAAEGGALGDLPREARKLVVVEGEDAAGRRVVGGCAEVGSLTEPKRVTLALETGVHLSVSLGDDEQRTGGLHAVVERGAEATAIPAISLQLTDGKRAPATETELRARLVGPRGEEVTTEILETDAEGTVDHAPQVTFTGPFAVDVIPRFALDPTPLRIPGMARPSDAELFPFTGSRPLWSVPTRLGQDGAGFVALVGDLDSPDHLEICLAVAEPGVNGIDVTPRRTCLSGEGIALPVGQVRRRSDLESVLLVQQVTGQLQPEVMVTPAPRLLAVGDAGGAVIREQVTVPPGALAQWVVPVGPCNLAESPGADTDSTPFVVALSWPQSASPTQLWLTDFGEETGKEPSNCAGVFPRKSLCVDDDRGVPHRLMFSTISIGDDVTAFVTDLSPRGVTMADAFDCSTARSQATPQFQQVTGLVTGEAEQLLLASVHGGSTMLLETMRVNNNREQPLLKHVSFLPATPYLGPSLFITGALVDPAHTGDIFAVVDLTDLVGTPGRGLFWISTGAAGTYGPVSATYGTLGCTRSVWPFLEPGESSCALLSHDVDGDGRSEILYSWVALAEVAPKHMILRFEEW